MAERVNIHRLKPTIWIGKSGCTQATIEEIRHQLKSRKIIKIRWLRNTEIDPVDIARRTGALLLQTRGRTMVLSDGRNAG
jgi:RNA-binding protein